MNQLIDAPAELGEFTRSVLAVLVCYEQRLDAADTVVTLANALSRIGATLDILVYDNSPVAIGADGLPSSFRPIYVHDPSNPGVSKGYNRGAEIARSMGKSWLLLLDQDTCFPESAVLEYFRGIQQAPDVQMFAPILLSRDVVISPCFFASAYGWGLQDARPGRLPLRKRSVVNSGMLIGLGAFQSLHGYNEKIELDFADHNFCRRFQPYFKTAYVVDLRCDHGFSSDARPELRTALARFAFFCRGARNSIITGLDPLSYTAIAFIRCLELCYRYRTVKFARIYLESYLLNRRRNLRKSTEENG